MQRQAPTAKILSLVLLFAICLLVFGCNGNPSSGSNAESSKTASEAASNIEKSNDSSEGAAGSAEHSDSSGSLEDANKLVVTLEEARRIFSCTMEGVTYSFPCNVSDVLNNGWAYGAHNSMEENRVLEPGVGLGGVYLTLGEVNEYGWADKQIKIDFMNFSDQAADWRQSTLLGMRCSGGGSNLFSWHDSPESDSHVSFSTGIGINIGDSAQAVIEKFGTWNARHPGDDMPRNSSSFPICVEDEGEIKHLGNMSFEQIDGIISAVSVSLSYMNVDLLSS